MTTCLKSSNCLLRCWLSLLLVSSPLPSALSPHSGCDVVENDRDSCLDAG